MAATIGEYVILGRDGSGAGFPYRVRNMGTDRESILKVIPDRHPSDGVLDEIARLREALQPIDDRGVLPPEDAGADSGGTVFLVYPATDGYSLSEVLALPGTPVTEDTRGLALALLGALGAAHAHGIVHGSLEPRAIVLQPDGTPAITDFGFRGLTPQASRTFLQPESKYWAPELSHDSPGTAAGDVFAVGAILRETLSEVVRANGSLGHPNEAVRESDTALLSLIAALTSVDLEQRPTAAEAIAALRRPVTASAPLAEPATRVPLARSGYRNISLFERSGSADSARHRSLIALLGIAAIVAVVGLSLAVVALMLFGSGSGEPNNRGESALATATFRPSQGAIVSTPQGTRGGVSGEAIAPTVQPTLAPEPTVAPTLEPPGVSEPAVSANPVARVEGDREALQSTLEDRASGNSAFYRSRDVADVAGIVTGSALATYQAEAARLIAIDAYIESTQTQMVIERLEATGDRATAVTLETWEHVDRRASTDAVLGSRRATARITYGLVYLDGRWLVDSISHQILTITPL